MKDGKRRGPYQPFLLKEMLEDGELTPGDVVWHEGMEKWQPLAETDSLKSVLQKPAPPPVEDESPQTEALRKVVTPAELTLELTLAVLRQRRALGWRRFFARQMDMFIASVVTVFVAAAFGWTDIWTLFFPRPWLLVLVPPLVWIPVETVMLCTLGWTPGRLILGLRVVANKEGQRPSFGAALKRSLLVWAGGFGFGLPVDTLLPLAQWLYSFWHFQRYGGTLWDHSAGTRVIFREFHRGHAMGLFAFNLALATLAAWLFIRAPLPERFNDAERKVLAPIRTEVWQAADPVAVPRNSGLP